MKHLHAAAGVLLLAVTACGDQQSVGFGGQPPPPSAPAVPKPVQERQVVPESAIDGSTLPIGFPRQVWTQDDGSVVVATGQEGGCSHVRAELSEQNSRHVTIVFVVQKPEPPRMCTMELRYPPLAVRLDAPLAQRTVVLQQREMKVPR